MTTIVLIRHAEPIIVKGAPSNGWVLSDAGQRAAAALASKLGGFGLTELSSSPEPKALQTAQIIAGQIGGQIHTDIRLREHDRSSVGFLTRDDFEASIASIFERPNDIAFGDESADAVHVRFSAAIKDAKARNSDVVAAITHGTALAIYVSRVAGIAPIPFWARLGMPVAVVIEENVVARVIQ